MGNGAWEESCHFAIFRVPSPISHFPFAISHLPCPVRPIAFSGLLYFPPMCRLALLVCALILCAGCSEPPQKEIDHAQGAIDAARAAGAEQYANAEFVAATSALQQAHEAVDQRDYRLALSRALDASERAQSAAQQAADGKARARSEAEGAIHTLDAAILQLQTKLKVAVTGRTPEAELKPARQTLADAERAVQKARAALKNGSYGEARNALNGRADAITAQIRALDQDAKARTGKKRR
jgi:hypothetical protein